MSTTLDEPVLTPAARRILEAATELFYSRGINSVGVELVAQEAGTTKKTIYDRFGSKDGLVVAYLQARARRWQAHVTDHLADVDGGAADRAVAVIDALESWLELADRGCGFVAAYAELCTSSERATGVVRAEKQWMREFLRRLLTEGGIDDGALARQLALVLEGAVVESTAGGSSHALDDARAVMRALVEGD